MAVTLRLERNRNDQQSRQRNSSTKKKSRKSFTQIQDVRERVSKWRQDRVRRVDTVERVLKQEQDEEDLLLSTDISSITSATSEMTNNHIDTTARRLRYDTSSQRPLRRVVKKLLRQREAKERAKKNTNQSEETWKSSFERLDRHRKGFLSSATFLRVLRVYVLFISQEKSLTKNVTRARTQVRPTFVES